MTEDGEPRVAQPSSPASPGSIPARKSPGFPTRSSSTFHSVRFLLSTFPISAFQYVGICLIAWLLLVEGGIELWYRAHERGVRDHAQWSLTWPNDRAVPACGWHALEIRFGLNAHSFRGSGTGRASIRV